MEGLRQISDDALIDELWFYRRAFAHYCAAYGWLYKHERGVIRDIKRECRRRGLDTRRARPQREV